MLTKLNTNQVYFYILPTNFRLHLDKSVIFLLFIGTLLVPQASFRVFSLPIFS